MPIVRIEHAVPAFDRWKQVFDSDPADRKGSGVRRYQVLHLREDPNYVMIDLEFDTIEACDGFLRTMQRIWSGPGASMMKNPRAQVVELVEAREL